jgi:D-sedoheptulose 7-phosphate isomerase
MDPLLPRLIQDVCQTFDKLVSQSDQFERIAGAIVQALRAGGKILTCGNGGSAADALHLAEELVGRFKRNRRSLPAICLNADATVLTCIANDFGYEEIFARQVEALAGKDDVLVCFTTSGNSSNILRALETAQNREVKSVALLGRDGGKAKGRATWELIVPSTDTARIQEAHTLLLHAILERVEQAFPD